MKFPFSLYWPVLRFICAPSECLSLDLTDAPPVPSSLKGERGVPGGTWESPSPAVPECVCACMLHARFQGITL